MCTRGFRLSLLLLLGWGLDGFALTIPENAKVGVVLSGGGARGLAHVGVIRVLESQGIKPFVVTGTSMGSIIGALYASGRNADEIERIARNMNWREALSDESPRRHQPYPFRQLEAGMTTNLRMSITRDGIKFPRGVIEGQHLEQVLGELFEQDGKPLSFEQMPVRFAAVATDLETGAQVIMHQGDVASAVRASMSVPGAIAPVNREGHLLVDGGIANNMPVDLARAMGADFIIAVDVSAPLNSRDQLTSLFVIANQITGFMVQSNVVQQGRLLRSDELLLVPPLNEFSSADFDKADGIIQAGVSVALEAFSIGTGDLPANQWAALTDSEMAAPTIDFIRVKNDGPVSDDVIRTLIRQQPGQALDRAQLEDDLSRLYGLDYFSVVRYRVIEENHQTGLVVVCVARETGNSWLKLGLQLADDFKGNSDFNLSASLRSAGLNRYGGTAFTRLQLGSMPEFETRFLQPLDSGLQYFVEPALGYRAGRIDIYLDDFQQEPLSSYNKADTWGSLALGRLLWREVAEVRMGITRIRGELDFDSGIDLLSTIDPSYEDGFYYLRFGWDSLDDLGFPTEGLRTSFTVEQHETSLQAEDNFKRYLGDFSLAFTVDRNTLLLEGDASFSDDDTSGFADVPFIGGFLELSGLPPRSRFGRHRALLRTVFYHQLEENGPLPFGVPVYLGGSLERGNVWLDRDNISWKDAIGAGSIFLAAHTPLGPAYLSFGATEEGDKIISIFLGQRFR